MATNGLEMLPTRNGVSGVTGSPAALATPVAAVLVTPLRTIGAATPPSRSSTNSTSRSSSADVRGGGRCRRLPRHQRVAGRARHCRRTSGLEVAEPPSSEAQAAGDSNAATAIRYPPNDRQRRSLTCLTPGPRSATSGRTSRSVPQLRRATDANCHPSLERDSTQVGHPSQRCCDSGRTNRCRDRFVPCGMGTTEALRIRKSSRTATSWQAFSAAWVQVRPAGLATAAVGFLPVTLIAASAARSGSRSCAPWLTHVLVPVLTAGAVALVRACGRATPACLLLPSSPASWPPCCTTASASAS